MKATLVLSESLANELRDVTLLDVETAGVLIARPVRTPGGDIRLLGREVRWVPDTAYSRRGADNLEIRSDGYVPALGAAEDVGAVAVWLHTHPGDGSSPSPSRHDYEVDRKLIDLFRLRTGNEFYGALTIAHRQGQLRFTGHLESDQGRHGIDRLWIVGRRFTLAFNDANPAAQLPALFDRNIRALGGEVQRVLGDLEIAIVGCGGTGSCVGEQLVRLGARRFVIADPDILSTSNLTRVYGSAPGDVGRLKVDVLASNIQRIAPDATVTRLASMVTVQETARSLTGADVIFGCTDDNAGRLVLSRMASFMATPVIDCGVLLTSSTGGRIDGVDGRVTVMAPGAACLVCRNRVDLQRASSELLSPTERRRRVDEGYAPALAGVEPAVVAYTTMVAAAAVGELLERLVHYGPEPTPSEILLRIHEREISTNDALPRERHYCNPASGKIGLGLSEPFLEQTW